MKFKIGDKARVKYVRAYEDSTWTAGVIITIHSLKSGIHINFGRLNYDCSVMLSHGETADVLFEQLEPIVSEKVNWADIEAEFKWNPTKEKIS